MNTIDRIQIKGFRTHRRIDVRLDPAITTITGRNFAGKSTIIRALIWVAMNEPLGTSFINWDMKKAAVRVTTEGNKITRTRSKSINSYKLNEKKPYTTFSKDVPPDIAKIFNVSSINFQGQQDGAFWFCETAGEVSRQLNAIINLDIIDTTLTNIASDARTAQTIINTTTKDLEQAIQRKKDLKYVKKLNKDLLNVESLQRRYLENAGLLLSLNESLKLVAEYKAVNDFQSRVATRGKEVLSKGRKYQKIAVRLEALSKLIETGTQLGIVLTHRPPSLIPLNKLMTVMKKKMDEYNLLKEVIEDIRISMERKTETERELKCLKQKLKKARGKRCPLCGSETMMS